MGRRIVRKRKPGVGILDDQPTATALEQYFDALKDLVPGEVATLYTAGIAIIPLDEENQAFIGSLIWAIFCLIGTAILIAKTSKTSATEPNKKQPIAWEQVAISCVTFILWVYTLDAPFIPSGWYIPWIGGLIALAWTFLTPFLYPPKK